MRHYESIPLAMRSRIFLYETSGNIAFNAEVVQLAAGSTEPMGNHLMPSILDKKIRFAYDVSRCTHFLLYDKQIPSFQTQSWVKSLLVAPESDEFRNSFVWELHSLNTDIYLFEYLSPPTEAGR